MYKVFEDHLMHEDSAQVRREEPREKLQCQFMIGIAQERGSKAKGL